MHDKHLASYTRSYEVGWLEANDDLEKYVRQHLAISANPELALDQAHVESTAAILRREIEAGMVRVAIATSMETADTRLGDPALVGEARVYPSGSTSIGPMAGKHRMPPEVYFYLDNLTRPDQRSSDASTILRREEVAAESAES